MPISLFQTQIFIKILSLHFAPIVVENTVHKLDIIVTIVKAHLNQLLHCFTGWHTVACCKFSFVQMTDEFFTFYFREVETITIEWQSEGVDSLGFSSLCAPLQV